MRKMLAVLLLSTSLVAPAMAVDAPPVLGPPGTTIQPPEIISSGSGVDAIEGVGPTSGGGEQLRGKAMKPPSKEAPAGDKASPSPPNTATPPMPPDPCDEGQSNIHMGGISINDLKCEDDTAMAEVADLSQQNVRILTGARKQLAKNRRLSEAVKAAQVQAADSGTKLKKSQDELVAKEKALADLKKESEDREAALSEQIKSFLANAVAAQQREVELRETLAGKESELAAAKAALVPPKAPESEPSKTPNAPAKPLGLKE